MSTAVLDVPSNLFDMVFDNSDLSPDKLGKRGGGSVNEDGFYHVVFGEPVPEIGDGKSPCMRVDMKVLAGTKEKQIGKMHFHRINLAKKGSVAGEYLPLSSGSREMLSNFFIHLGLMTADDARAAGCRYPWEKLEFFQAVIEVKNEPYDEKDQNGNPTGQKRDSFRIPYGCNVWQVGDERVAHVPKDPDALADFTGGAGVGDIDDI